MAAIDGKKKDIKKRNRMEVLRGTQEEKERGGVQERSRLGKGEGKSNEKGR